MTYKTSGQLLRYGFAASLGLVIDFATVIVFTELLSFYYLLSVSIGFTFGLIVTFQISKKYVFGTPKGNPQKNFFLFGIIGLVGLGMLNLIVLGLTDLAGINYLISKILATIVVFLWNFFARKTLFANDDQDHAL